MKAKRDDKDFAIVIGFMSFMLGMFGGSMKIAYLIPKEACIILIAVGIVIMGIAKLTDN